MRIDIEILNPEQYNIINGEYHHNKTWRSRRKSYESDQMDEDMIDSTVSHKVERITLNDVQLTSKSSADGLIDFLMRARESFEH